MRIEWIDRKLQLIKNELGLGPVLGSAALFLAASALLFVVLWFVDSAPPSTITLIGGPADSLFQHNADKYSAILARNGVRLKIIPSQGSLENLVHLSDPSFHNDVGLVQGGLIQSGLLSGLNTSSLVSLGSVFYEPLLVFYKDKKEVDRLVQFKGKKLAIDLPGSGTHALATTLLKANGIDESDTTTELLDMEAEDGAAELVSGKIDAVFLMGDSASIKLIGSLLRTPGIRLMSFAQADAYTRKFNYLNKIELPEGGIDLGKDIPPHNVTLIGPTVELVARSGLHPALSDLLLEAAHEVHGKAGLLQHQGDVSRAFGARIPYQRRRRSLLSIWQKFPLSQSAILDGDIGEPSGGHTRPAHGGVDPRLAHIAISVSLAHPLAYHQMVRRIAGVGARPTQSERCCGTSGNAQTSG